MIILGIDPGTTRVGYAVIEKKDRNNLNLLIYGCLKINKKSQPERLAEISKSILDLISKYRPQTMAIEKLFFTKNVKTALSVSEARGVIINCANSNNLNVLEFTPLEVKLAIAGYGKAEKCQVQKMVYNILKLDEIPRQDDAADAIAIGLTACYTNAKLSNKS